MTTSTHTPQQKSISGKCLLETEGYRIVFELKTLETTKQDVDMVVEFQLNPCLSNMVVKSKPAFISIKDLQRLVTYFEEHIALLEEDPDSESYTFTTYGLGFQLQGLSGEMRSPNDGEFSIRVMLNVGESNLENSRTYVGGESVVTLENIHNFTLSLQALLIELGFIPSCLLS
jgi:hypothetical protein